MKATGIVRRIDELGRVVVPKEIRKVLRIREGDPLEIYTDSEGLIILKKYSHVGELGNYALKYAESLAQVMNVLIAIADRDEIVAVSGGLKKDYIGRHVSKSLDEIMASRENIMIPIGKHIINVADNMEIEAATQIIYNIVSDGDIIGCIIAYRKEENKPFNEVEQKIISVASSFLGKQMEN